MSLEAKSAETPKIIPEELVQKRFEELVRNFDFDFLRKKIEEIIIRCGKTAADVRMTPPEGITDISKSQGRLKYAMGYYSNGFLGINMRSILETTDDPEKQALIFAHVLIHEEMHSAMRGAPGQSGFSYDFMAWILHEAWNEGVTEKLSREIVEEYYVAHGYSGQADQLIERYEIPREFLELVIKTISEKTGVAKTVVWEAIIRAAFVEHELDFSDDKTIVPPEFWEKLAYASEKDFKNGLVDFETRPLRSFMGIPEENQPAIKEDTGLVKLVKLIAKRLGFTIKN